MALFNLFKPKWQHSDPLVRQQAIAKLPATDRETLGRIATGDPEPLVRQAALERLDDWRLLAALVESTEDPVVKGELRERIDTLLLGALLAAVGVEAKCAILSQIGQEALLARVAVEEAEADIRLAAVERITDQGALAELVTKSCGKGPALLAIERLTDESLLRRVALEASSRSVRARAEQKVAAIETERNRPSLEALRQRELAELLGQARQLCEVDNHELALLELRKLQSRWQGIAGQEGEGWQELEECAVLIQVRRQEAARREEARLAALREQEARHDRLRQIIAEIEALGQTHAGSEEAAMVCLRQEWTGLEGALGGGMPPGLVERYREVTEAFARSRAAIGVEAEEEGRLLATLATVPPAIEALNLEQAAGVLGEVQRSFADWQPRFVGRQQVAAELSRLRDLHREAQVRNEAAREERLHANLEARQELLRELAGLLTAADLSQAEKRVKEIKESWRQPLELPPDSPDLEPEFEKAVRLFAQKLGILRKEAAWQRWQNKNLKSELIAEAEGLDGIDDLRQVFKRIKELQEGWRAIGPAAAKEENALWNRFRGATERNFARCREFFKVLEEDAERNLQEMIRLRDLAIAHQDSSEWQKNAEFIKGLQAQWKATGRGPQDKEQEVFKAFRAACDHFFERRQAHHLALDQERLANLGRKEALCLEAEALAEQPDGTHTAKIQELQVAWKAIGPVPRGQEEAIWLRFRAACDRHYAWLDTLRPENLAQKEALCLEVEQLTEAIGPETNFPQIAKKIVVLQRRWKEIGPVPKEVRESIWQRFKGRCDAFYEAKSRHDQAIDRQRPENQAKKEAMLARIRELSTATLITREVVREIRTIQEEWQRLGPAGMESERQLQQDFRVVCDTFFKERREAFQEIDQLHQENLKKKEALCLRLELLAGLTPPPPAMVQGQAKKGGLTLAEQLKVAFETNFVLSSESGGDKKRRAKDEIEAVKEEWQQIGPVPREHEHSLRKRYSEALTAAMKV